MRKLSLSIFYLFLLLNQSKSFNCGDPGMGTNCKTIYTLKNNICTTIKKITKQEISPICKCNEMKIVIHKREITKIGEKSFESCSHLKRISFYENKIESIPGKTFHGLKELEKLEFGGNKLTRIEKEWFVDLVSLEELHLQKNKIEFIPDEMLITMPKLKKLILFSNKIQHFNVQETKQLETLYLADNPLNCRTIDELTTTLGSKLNNEIFFNDMKKNNDTITYKGFDCRNSTLPKSDQETVELDFFQKVNGSTIGYFRDRDKTADKTIITCDEDCIVTVLAIATVVTGVNGLILVLLVFKCKITHITF